MRKILLVDDSEEVRELYELALSDKGYEVKTAALAEDALEVLRAEAWRPDLVITDLFMPGMGGLELITRIRSDRVPPIPVLVISGFPDAKDEALRRGAVRFEAKPVSVDELRHIVEDVLSGAAAPRLRDVDTLKERRAATRAIGEATLARFMTEHPDLDTKVARHAKALARFFDCGAVLTFLLRDGRLTIAASSDARYQVGVEATEALPLVNDVVESGTSIVLTSGASRYTRPTTKSLPVEFLVAVPYVVDGAAVGAFCVVDTVPHAFGSAYLGILEYMTRRGSAVVRGGPRIIDESGLLDRAAFGAVLSGAALTAAESGDALGFAMFETTEIPRDDSLGDIYESMPAPSLMLGVFDRRHLVTLAVAESGERVKERLALVRGQVEPRIRLSAVAEVTYEDPAPRSPPEVFFDRGLELLERAARQRTPERVAFIAVDARRR